MFRYKPDTIVSYFMMSLAFWGGGESIILYLFFVNMFISPCVSSMSIHFVGLIPAATLLNILRGGKEKKRDQNSRSRQKSKGVYFLLSVIDSRGISIASQEKSRRCQLHSYVRCYFRSY